MVYSKTKRNFPQSNAPSCVISDWYFCRLNFKVNVAPRVICCLPQTFPKGEVKYGSYDTRLVLMPQRTTPVTPCVPWTMYLV